MQYKAIIHERKNYYEATSYYYRQTDSELWSKLNKLKKGSLEETILNAVLKIASERKKKRIKIIMEIK